MSRVRSNVVANIAGQAWTILLSLLCTPFYIRFLGVEAYGVFAFYLLVQSIVLVLDLGLGGTLNREVARYRAGSAEADGLSFRAFISSLERWYWGLGLALGIGLFAALPEIAKWWLRPEHLSASELVDAARVFSLIAFLQWPSMFYQTALAGMQRQVALNVINIPFATIGSVGGVLFIWLGPRSISALLGWQAAWLLVSIGVTYAFFWREVGFARVRVKGIFAILRQHWRFSAGMGAISITGLILMHIDKLLLSRLLPLASFAHYSLAVTVARGLYVLISPIFGAYFPRLSSLVGRDDEDSVRACYRAATQLMAALILPLAATIALFSEEIVRLWLRDARLAAEIGPLVTCLAIGTCLNGLMNIPFALQLAYGRTKIGLLINIGLVVTIVPSTIFAATRYGAPGGAAIWMILNAVYLAVGLPITHKLLMPGHFSRWLSDVVPPLLAALVAAGTIRLLAPSRLDSWSTATWLALCWLVGTFGALFAAAQTRAWLRTFFRGSFA